MGIRQRCIICGDKNAELGYDLNNESLSGYKYYMCPSCGRYIIPESSYFLFDDNLSQGQPDLYDKARLEKYLFYNKVKNRNAFIGTQHAFDAYKKIKPDSEAFLVTKETVDNWYPKTFSEKINYLLLKLYSEAAYDGDYIDAKVLDKSIFYMDSYCPKNDNEERREIQFRYIVNYLRQNNLVVYGSDILQLTPIALERIYDLQKNHANNKNVFVAMSFHESTDDIRAAIRQGIENAEYSSVLMDEIYHNHQIVPEMLRLIKESRFMIMDITQPNFGAYYEAGYALGLGKEVIITCSQEVWDKKDFSCNINKECYYKQIATKPHFDIAQKQVLVWKDFMDLTKKLTEWIKHIIG